MFKNYFKTTLRHLLKSKLNFAFKLGGLTLALFSFLVIIIYVSFQFSFDRFSQDYKDIYRVGSVRDHNGTMERYATVPPGVGQSLKSEFPEIKSFTRIGYSDTELIKYNNVLLRSDGFVEADTSIFSVFTFDFLRGNKYSFARPGTIVLTRSLAARIFKDEDPIGKLISFPQKHDQVVEVTAIVEDLPLNTHLSIKAIMPMKIQNNPWAVTWDGSVNLYILLHPDTHPERFAEKARSLLQRNIIRSMEGSEKNFGIFLQPISEIYLGPNLKMEFHEKGSALYVYIFSVLGFFLLAIASINYVNLSIADFHNRSKEIGIRKILGARRKQIALHVTIESIAFCFLGLLISILVLYYFFPKVLQILDPRLQLNMLRNSDVLLVIALTFFLLVAFSTIYPAIQLGLNNPINDLKSISGFGNKASVAKSLLLLQFTISIICISATLTIGSQIDFIKTKDLGYDRHNVVTLVMPDEYPTEKVSILKNELSKLKDVEAVSYSYYHMTGVPYFKGWYKVEIGGEMKQREINELFVDHDYLRTMNIELTAGRNFDITNPADSHNAFIINETAAREFGWSSPIGKRISVVTSESEKEKWEGAIIGVVKDFNTRPLREKIEPIVLRLQFDSWPGYALSIKTRTDVKAILPVIKSTYENVLPGFLADYRLVEEMYDRQYNNENKALTVLQFGTWIILLISALGIFSLSIYMSMKRMKEFGIRKVLGASSSQITFLHVGHFMKIALLANAIALPVAYWLMKEWLDGFAYRTELSGIVFVAVMLISFLLVIISAGYSSLKAGRMNPVEVIKIQ